MRSIVTVLILIVATAACGPEKQLPASQTVALNEPAGPVAKSDSKQAAESPAVQQDPVSLSRSNAITRAVQKAGPAIVSITVTELRRGYQREFDPLFFRYFNIPIQREVQSMGSGFIISEDGLVVTNEHVVSENTEKIVVALSDGSTHEAELIGADALADLALLQIKGEREKYPYVNFADSDDIMVGEWALAMGNPFGLFSDGQPSVTVGVVSATERDFRPDPQEPRVYVGMIQTDASINSGNSGGPLVNSEGEVMGVNTFIYTGGTSKGFVGLGFAIPSNRVRKIIDQLQISGEVALNFDPGMKIIPLTRQLQPVYDNSNVPVVGLLVSEVNKAGPAYESGIMPGDVITKIGGIRVNSALHAKALLREYSEGESLEIELVRKGQIFETEMILRKKADGGQ